MLEGQLTEAQALWLERPTAAAQGQVLAPGIKKQWGLGFMLMPNGSPTGRSEGTATWEGTTRKTSVQQGQNCIDS